MRVTVKNKQNKTKHRDMLGMFNLRQREKECRSVWTILGELTCKTPRCGWSKHSLCWVLGFPRGPSSRESACQCRRLKRHRFDPWVGKIPCSKTHSRIPAWKTPWIEEPGGLRSMGSRTVGHDWTHMHALGVAGTAVVWASGLLASKLCDPLPVCLWTSHTLACLKNETLVQLTFKILLHF